MKRLLPTVHRRWYLPRQHLLRTRSLMQSSKESPMHSRRHFVFTLAALTLATTAFSLQAAETPKVSLKTSMGEIVLELNPQKAPKTVENFLQYVRSGHYKDTIFHRVIDGFMIQGGGMDKTMAEKPTKSP